MAANRLVPYRVLTGSPWRAPITDRVSPKVQDVELDTGSGSFSLKNGSANQPLVQPGGVIAWAVDGVEAAWTICERVDQATDQPEEEIGEDTAYSGRGILAELEQAKVYPSIGLGKKPFGDIRYFDYSSPELDTTGWTAAVERFTQCQNPFLTPPNGIFGAPNPWPDPAGVWISSRALSGDHDPIGTWYARKTFTLAEDSELVINAAADDAYDLRLDGTPIVGWDDPPGIDGWQKARFVRVSVSAGTHVLAVRVTNYDRTITSGSNTGNISVFLCAVYKLTDTIFGRIQQLLLRSDHTWICSDYPTIAPGFTPPRIMEILVQNAVARGTIPAWATSWTPGGATDTAGTSCPIITQSFRHGSSVLEAAQQMSQGWIEFAAHMSAASATRVFDLWMAEGAPTGPGWSLVAPGRGTTRALAIEPAVNATEITHVGDVSKLATVLMVRYDDGYFEVVNADAVAQYGRREAFLSLNDFKDLAAANRTGLASLDELDQAVETIEVGQWAATGADAPGTAYITGDKITSIDRSGSDTLCRVAGWTASEEKAGLLVVVPELNFAQKTHSQDIDRWLQRTTPGALDGRSAAATPDSPAIVDSGTIDDQEFSWSQPGDAELQIGVPIFGKVAVKVVQLKIEASATIAGSTPTIWTLYRNAVAVATVTLPVGSTSVTRCLADTDGVIGLVGTRWNAAVTQAGSHTHSGLAASYVEIS